MEDGAAGEAEGAWAATLVGSEVHGADWLANICVSTFIYVRG